tara:strand:+ start:1833 stop:2246 length:414 start_codon:yes stop_codon:yes gene_type:complete
MGIEAAIYSALSGSTSLTALVGTRIYPNTVPQNVTFPHVSFAIDGNEKFHGLNTTESLARASVSVDCYTENSYLDAVNIANVVRNILNTQSTTWGSLSVQNAHVGSETDLGAIKPTDGSDDYIYTRSLDCDVFYYST